MDDINFDELDKAVNSVLQQPAEPKPAEQDDSAVSDIQTTDQQLEMPSERPEKEQQSFVPRRRGQFMDLVHPSSDMTSTTAKDRVLVPSRQAPSLKPLDPSIMVADADKTDETPVVVPSSEVPPESLVEHKADWPDPLDLEGQTEDTGFDESSEVTKVESGFASESSEEGVQTVPQTSPFVDGTEVEKRPLSAFADTPVDNQETDNEQTEVVDNSQPTTEVALPEELSPEVVSVEADDLSASAETGGEVPGVEDGLAMSIAPQYKTAAADEVSDQDGGHPVFDTKDYHQPLTPPVKESKSGKAVKYILVTLLVIALGIAAGYSAWAFKLF